MTTQLIFSGLVYVLVTYFLFLSIKKKKGEDNEDDDEGGIGFDLTPPQIDLPPGISWPVSPVKEEVLEES